MLVFYLFTSQFFFLVHYVIIYVVFHTLLAIFELIRNNIGIEIITHFVLNKHVEPLFLFHMA